MRGLSKEKGVKSIPNSLTTLRETGRGGRFTSGMKSKSLLSYLSSTRNEEARNQMGVDVLALLSLKLNLLPWQKKVNYEKS